MDFTFSPQMAPTCAPAVAPNVAQYFGTVAAASGATPISAITLASGAKALSSVLISNSGCKPLRVTATYLTGGDCNTCNDPDVLVPVTVNIDVPGRVSKWELAPGFISAVSFVTLDVVGTAGTATNVTNAQDVVMYGTSSLVCPDCAILVP